MNTDDLRDALGDDVRRQPPVSPDFRDGIDSRVRRQRVKRAAIAAPVLVLLLAATVVLVGPKGNQDTTLAAADGGSGGTVVGTSVVPVPGSTVVVPTTAEHPGATDTTAPTPSPSTAPSASGGPSASTDCGTVTFGTDASDKVDTAPLQCFLQAVKADGAATLVVVTNGKDGGSMTEHATLTPGRHLSVAAEGSISMKLPSMSFGSGGQGGVAPPTAEPVDCGTVTMAAPEAGTKGSGHTVPSASDLQGMTCLFKAFTSGAEAHETIIVKSPEGGSLTLSIAISADHVLDVSIDGTVITTLPADTKAIDQILGALPSGETTIGQLFSGLGGKGGWHK